MKTTLYPDYDPIVHNDDEFEIILLSARSDLTVDCGERWWDELNPDLINEQKIKVVMMSESGSRFHQPTKVRAKEVGSCLVEGSGFDQTTTSIFQEDGPFVSSSPKRIQCVPSMSVSVNEEARVANVIQILREEHERHHQLVTRTINALEMLVNRKSQSPSNQL